MAKAKITESTVNGPEGTVAEMIHRFALAKSLFHSDTFPGQVHGKISCASASGRALKHSSIWDLCQLGSGGTKPQRSAQLKESGSGTRKSKRPLTSFWRWPKDGMSEAKTTAR